MLKKHILALSFTIVAAVGYSQQTGSYLEKGHLSSGLRTTGSFFGHDGVPGLGTGGHFRVQLFDFLSTEWFADWITLDLKGAGTRNNAHVGWSVMFYPKKTDRFVPYIMAGHCFDYAEVTPLSTNFTDRSSEKINRWSSAVQAGVGAHYFLTDRFNITLSAQYMLHLSNHLDYELTQTGNGYYLTTNTVGTHSGATLEGHLLTTLSLNYRIADLW